MTSKQINQIARKLHVRVRRTGDSFFIRTTILGNEAETLHWLKQVAVRRGLLPTTALPEGDGVRAYTECNGTDPNHKML
jgi:hypothetical protein